ncbi:MAG: amidohydrolase family protein, partial [Sneathiellaceae bacterium]
MADAEPDVKVIRHADWLVAWDTGSQRHAYLRDADLAFQGDTIRFVGQGYDGPADEVIDGRGRLVMPGLVNIHSHPSSEPMRKGITDETRSPGFWHSSLYEHLPVFDVDRPEDMQACLKVALAELLLSGVTTLVDLWFDYDGWLDTLADSGMRVCAAPMFRDARWSTRDGHSLTYDWAPEQGRAGFETAMRVIDRANQHPSGRLSGMVAPAQVDTCTADLLRDAAAFARARGLPFQIHAAQSPSEFHEMVRRHGKTPIQWLDALGVLNERAIIG